MPCQILVSNKSGLPKAEIVVVVDGDHLWSKNETLLNWQKDGESFESWPRTFSLVIVTDKTEEELRYLQGYNSAGDRQWFFIEPEQTTDEWSELYLTGQTERPWSVVSSFIGER